MQAIVKRLDRSRASTHMHSYEHYSRALGVWESALRLDPMEQWLEATRGLEFALDPLAEALAILMEQASWNYYDILGSVYMELGQGDKRFGQYFTPWSVAKMMAELTLSDFKPPAPGEPPLRFCEPCVGSGILILAAAESIEERFPGTIASGGVEFYGQDIDACCVAMCRLNMKLHGIGRAVERFEDLTLPQRRMLERLLGRSLPQKGRLLVGTDSRQGDTLLDGAVPLAAKEEDERGERETELQGARVLEAANEREEEPPGPGLVALPPLVAQELWMTLDSEPTAQEVQSPTPRTRRQGRRGAKVEPAEYSPGLLFPTQQDE